MKINRFSISLVHVFLILACLLSADLAVAHERWVLSPGEILEWNAKPKPSTFTEVNAVNVSILGVAFLFTLAWVRLGFTSSRELFQGLVAQLNAHAHWASVILRFCLAWGLISSALALEPRLGNATMASPTLLAPDLEIKLAGAEWMFLVEVQIVLGILFLFGIYTRLAAFLLFLAVFLGFYLFGSAMNGYALSIWGVAIYLMTQGPGSHYIAMPVPGFLKGIENWLANQPRARAQFILRWAAGLNFFLLGVWFKVLQPNLALAVVTIYDVPILNSAPESFVLVMAVVEVLAGIFLFLGILLRPIAFFLLGAMIFFASVLPETLTAHMVAYGIMLTFILNGAGHWQRKAKDKPGRIVILGGGFAGVQAAMYLDKLRGLYSNVEVTLVHARSEFLFTPLLPEVIGGSVQPGNIVNPLRRLVEHSKVVQGEVTQVDHEKRLVKLTNRRGDPIELAYDELILCNEAVPNFARVPGMAEYSLPIDNIGDALFVRKTVIQRLQEAEMTEDMVERQRLLSFSVIGGGELGSATALELNRFIQAALPVYPSISGENIRISLFENSEGVAQFLPKRLKKARDRVLKQANIEILDGVLPKHITARGLEFTDGTRLPAATIINADLRNPDFGLPANEDGYLTTEANLSLIDLAHVWVASTSDAKLKDRHVSLSEKRARGMTAAYNAYAMTQKSKAHRYSSATKWLRVLHLGRSSVASFIGLPFSGWLAWQTSRVDAMFTLPGLERVLRVMLDWMLDIPFCRDIAVLAPERSNNPSRVAFHAGETIIHQGEDGQKAFVIRSGNVRAMVDGQEVAQMQAGECFGESALLTGHACRATFVAATDCELTILAREQFMDLNDGFRELADALSKKGQALLHAPIQTQQA